MTIAQSRHGAKDEADDDPDEASNPSRSSAASTREYRRLPIAISKV